MADKILRYWIMVPSGLEEVALEELRERAPHIKGVNVEPGGRMGQIFFNYERSPSQLADLRSAVHWAGLVAEVHRITVGRPGIDRIRDKVARIDMASVRSLAKSQMAGVDCTTFALSATLQGKYRFKTSELVRAVSEVLREKHGLREGQGQGVLRFHLQLTGRRALLGLRLGDGNTPGAAVAWCLARLLALEPGARILWARRDRDELAALQAFFAPAQLIAIAARQRKPDTTKTTTTLVAKRGELPLKPGLFDYIFDLTQGDYAADLAELARILRFGGIAIVQVEQSEGFFAVLEAEDYPLVVLAHLDFREHGRKYGLVILERLEEYDPSLLQVDWGV